MSVSVKYKGETIATAKNGQTIEIDTKGHKCTENFFVHNYGGGNFSINGIVREYEVNAGASVSAGDFVEFVNKCGAGEFHPGTTSCLSACKLDNNRVLVVYSDGNLSYGTAVVLNIENGTVSLGKEFIYSNDPVSGASLAVLTENTVIVVYSVGGNIIATVFKIDGTNISVSASKKLLSSSDIGGISVCRLSDSKVFFAFITNPASSIPYTNVGMVTIGNDSMSLYQRNVTKGTSYKKSSIVAFSETKVCVLFTGNSTALYTIAIDGTTISIGEVLHLNTSSYGSIVALTENKLVCVIKRIAKLITLNGTIINEVSHCVFSGENWISATALSDNKVVVAYDGSAQVLTIDGTTISAGEVVIFHSGATEGSSEGTYKSVISFSDNSALVVYVGGNLGMYSSLSIDGDKITVNEIPNNGTKVQKATSNLHNVGVAKTSGEEGETVEVYCAI